MSDPFFLVAATVLGAMIGSFLNAVIYRLPRSRYPEYYADRGDSAKSVGFGNRSVCPSCGARIPAWLNVPVLAWLWLRGRAACCGARISARYPLVEVLTAGLFFLLAWAPPSGQPLVAGVPLIAPLLPFLFHGFFVSVLIANTFIDFDIKILPDVLTKPTMVVGVVGSFVCPGLAGSLELRLPEVPGSVLASVVGLLVGLGLTWAVRVGARAAFGKEAMGLGDVKLMGGVGAFLGWDGALLTFFVGCVSGAVFGIAHKVVTKDSYIAFGPFLVLGAIVTMFLRTPIVDFLTVTWPEWQAENLNTPWFAALTAVICFVLLVVLIRRGRTS